MQTKEEILEKREKSFKTLELPQDASGDEIRKKYQKLARTYHPDYAKNIPDAEEKFKEVSGAYEFLKNNPATAPTSSHNDQSSDASDIVSTWRHIIKSGSTAEIRSLFDDNESK